jgi:tyrosinase
MSPAVPAARASGALAPLRHRRSARRLTAGQAADLRAAITAAQGIADDRGFQFHAGIHGLPLPISCQHGTPLFLPWHRAYLYLFERALQDLVAGVTLPWWDWTHRHADGIPSLYAHGQADGTANPLHGGPIQPSGREPGGPDHTTRDPGAPGAPPLPSARDVENVLDLRDFTDFSLALEDIHNGVHVWVGGTMSEIPVAAYDPLFWAHHAMIDRVWRLWQLRHPHAGPPHSLRHRALRPFPLTVADVLDTDALGYDYAASTAAVAGPGHHG